MKKIVPMLFLSQFVAWQTVLIGANELEHEHFVLLKTFYILNTTVHTVFILKVFLVFIENYLIT